MFKLCYDATLTRGFNNLTDDVKWADEAGFDSISLHLDAVSDYLKRGGSLNDLQALFESRRIEVDAMRVLLMYPEFNSQHDPYPEKGAQMVESLTLLQQIFLKIHCPSCVVVAPVVDDPEDLNLYPNSVVMGECSRVLKDIAKNLSYLSFALAPLARADCLIPDLTMALCLTREVGMAKVGLDLECDALFAPDEIPVLPEFRAGEIKSVSVMAGSVPYQKQTTAVLRALFANHYKGSLCNSYVSEEGENLSQRELIFENYRLLKQAVDAVAQEA